MTVIIGLSDKHTVMADLDNMSFKKAVNYAKLTMEHFGLNGFILLKSSENNYHVVFDRPVYSWNKILKVIAWMGIITNNPNLQKWLCMQIIKDSCTLRISGKPNNPHPKHKPRVVYRCGSQNRMVQDFLERRSGVYRAVGKALRKVEIC